jgi:hypothetical protein
MEMGATSLKETQFRKVQDKIKSVEQALAELQKIAFPMPGMKVTIARYKLQITKMKRHLADLEKLYFRKRANAVRPSLLLLKESASDPSYVGSVRSEEAYSTAHKWLNVYQASSADEFYQQVQTAVVNYAKLKKSNGK